MRIITFEDKDARTLLDQLKLTALEDGKPFVRHALSEGKLDEATSQLHRSFHMVVVRWLQSQGASVAR